VAGSYAEHGSLPPASVEMDSPVASIDAVELPQPPGTKMTLLERRSETCKPRS
jgi:hypothetical protein